jgi:hypothetical protein
VHLVVWTKFALPDETDTHKLSAKAREEIEAFVARVFSAELGPENVSFSVMVG